MRIASSLTREFSFFVAGVLRVVAFFRGEVVFLAAGFAAFPFNAAPSDGACCLSLIFAFFGMGKQVSLYPAKLDSQAVLTYSRNRWFRKKASAPGPRLQKAAERAVALTLRWNDEYARQSFASSLDFAAAKAQLTAHGPCQLGRPGPGDGVKRGTFRLTCTADPQELEIGLEESSARIAELKLRPPRDPQQKCPRL